ncbi:nuclear transport factor 2 domain protein [Ancylostoma caninum]|uniref:Conserved oligomeric Golgi complex subunit 3 n=1 Tax=Ancylostoma caninum TaxID=29170 RepID=A0A368FLW8_ANCCA|nr:nuclear transport factor 2 domain protein [Ancylostoma caninum]
MRRLFQEKFFRSKMTTEADKLDEEICKEASSFTKIFYDAMDRKRDKINYLYCDSGATLVWNGNPVSGCDNIFKFISSLPETDHHLVSVDVQRVNAGLPGSPDLLTVTTAGNVTLGGTMHGFTHTFILMVEDGKYKTTVYAARDFDTLTELLSHTMMYISLHARYISYYYGTYILYLDAVLDDFNCVTGDSVLASALCSAIRDARNMELPLVEKQEAPEVVALRANMQRLRLLKERMGVCTKTMAELRSSYASVTARTSSLHDACDRALAYQTALAAGAEQIRTNLHFFKQADIIMKKLNNTTKISVTGQMFTGILATIDECLTFLRQHPEYKESAAYIVKYEQCLSRAMTWIRVGVMADIEASVNDVRDRQSQLQVDYAKLGRGGADDDTFALLYGVFATRANSVKAALSVAEQRFSQVPELKAMLAECQQAYFNTRQQLLTPIIQATLAHMASTYADSSCALTRSSCAFILGLCDDEFRLYRQFFSTGSASKEYFCGPAPSIASTQQQQTDALHPFEEFIEAICRLLYDMLRPIIIHNPHLETLAELCTILKVEMIEERCSVIPAIVTEECTSFDPRAGFVRVIGELVGDVAERIVYRAALYGQTDIAGYKPATGDLAYPEKLEMMKSIEKERQKEGSDAAENQETECVRKDSTSARPSPAPISAVDLHCLWYPTVRRTVMCLAKLYRCLDVSISIYIFRSCLRVAVFQSIARDLLAMCCESLEAAALHISASPSKKTGHTKKLDGELFLVKHLLILREQTTPYRQAAYRADTTLPTLDCSIDFAKMKSSFFDDKSRWFELSSNNAFLELLFSVPIYVSEQSGDTRRIIDTQLRTRCNQLISTSADVVVGPLLKWVDKAEDELLKSDFDLKKHPDLAPAKLSELAKAAVKALSHAWPELCATYSLYIGVAETEAILLSPVRKRIADTFARALSFAARAYDDEGRSIAALPTVQHIYLLLNKE